MPKILIVDDDRAVVDLLRRILSEYETVFASDGVAALHLIETEQPNLILLDLRMPDMDGAVLLPRIRAITRAGIIVLSARDNQSDRVPALAIADDFIAKPFDLYDLLARVGAVLRRTARIPLRVRPAADHIQVGEVTVAVKQGVVTVDGREVIPTPTEFRLLVALATHAGEVMPRRQLAEDVWGYADASTGHLVDVHIGRLRRKLRDAGSGKVIVAIRRVGFRLVPRLLIEEGTP